MSVWAAVPLANAGTPLLWASCFTLVFGNILIGMFEAWLIGRILGVPLPRRFGLRMIAANYLSMLLAFGGKIVAFDMSDTVNRHITIENVLWVHLGAYLTAFLLTLLVEWPFVAACVRSIRAKGGAFRVNLVVQAASNVLLLLLAMPFGASVFGYLPGVKIEPVSQFADPGNAWVYFVSAADGNLWRTRADGSQQELCRARAALHGVYGLYGQYSHERDTWDLYLRGAQGEQIIQTDFASALPTNDERRAYRAEALNTMSEKTFNQATTAEALHRRHMISVHQEPPMNPFQQGARLAARTKMSQESDWIVQIGYPPSAGLRARNNATGEKVQIAVETTLIRSWAARYPVLLNRRQVVFQLGDQILLADLDRRKVGLLARGAGLVVVEDDDLIVADATR